MLLTLGGLGVPHTIAYFTSARSARTGDVLGTSLVFAAVQTALIVSFGYMLIPFVLGRENFVAIPLSRTYLLSVPLSLVTGISLGVLQGNLAMREFNSLRMLQSILYTGGVMILWLARIDDLWWMVRLSLINLSLAACIGIVLASSKVKRTNGRLRWDSSLAREMLSYGLRTQLSNTAEGLNLRLDQLLMSLILAPASLGLYVVAVTFSKLLNPVSHAIGIVVLPTIARSGPAQVVQRFGTLFRGSLVILLTLGTALTISLPVLLPLVVGETYSAAVVPAQVLALGGIFLGLNDLLNEALRGIKRPGVPATGQAISLGLTVILLYLLLPRMGILGAAVTSSIAYGATFGFELFMLRRSIHFTWHDIVPTLEDWRQLRSVAYDLVPDRWKTGRL